MKEKGGNPIISGVQAFFVDSGISIILGLLLGFLLSTAGIINEASFDDTTLLFLLVFFGSVISVYASMYLYRRLSSERVALLTLILMSLIAYVPAAHALETDLGFSNTDLIWAAFITPAGYFIGWYLAEHLKRFVPFPSYKWALGFAVIGVILFFVDFTVLALDYF